MCNNVCERESQKSNNINDNGKANDNMTIEES